RGSLALSEDGDDPDQTVTITLQDGTEYERTQKTHKGHPDDMLSVEEFVDLFRLNAGKVLSPEQVERLADFILHVEDRNLADFGALLVPQRAV
ncbi:MAG: hypothetical protein LBP28_00005, partial [Coriobacteriales bacterium]|nr:hypothetical protein [Coriobacteriales bacterium]